MTTQYFSHDINAQHDNKCVALLTTLGWKGYGVFWGIVERMHERPGCRLAYNPKGLAWSLHVTEKFLVRVITEFNLFTFSEDGTEFWSESAVRRQEFRAKRLAPKAARKKKIETDFVTEAEAEVEAKIEPAVKEAADKPKRKRGRPRKNPLPEPVANIDEQITQESNQSKPEPETKPEPPVAFVVPEVQTPADETGRESITPLKEDPNVPLLTPSFSSEWQDDVRTEEVKPLPAEDIIALWNEKFVGTRQTYRGLCLDSISLQRAYESLSSGYTLNDFERAFQVARNDNFNWLLKDVLKKDNIQRLLVKGDKQNERQNFSGASSTGSSVSSGSSDWLPSNWQQFVHDDE